MSRVAKALVPKVGGAGKESLRSGDMRIEVVVAITSENHRAGTMILDRKTKIIKVNVNRIVTS